MCHDDQDLDPGQKGQSFLYPVPAQGSRQRHFEKVAGDVDVQSQDQPCHQGPPIDDVPVLDGIRFFQ